MAEIEPLWPLLTFCSSRVDILCCIDLLYSKHAKLPSSEWIIILAFWVRILVKNWIKELINAHVHIFCKSWRKSRVNDFCVVAYLIMTVSSVGWRPVNCCLSDSSCVWFIHDSQFCKPTQLLFLVIAVIVPTSCCRAEYSRASLFWAGYYMRR